MGKHLAAVSCRCGTRATRLPRAHQGQRTDRELVEKVPQVSRGTETREAAAKLSGFGNDRTYRQAKEIVEAAEAEPEKYGGKKGY